MRCQANHTLDSFSQTSAIVLQSLLYRLQNLSDQEMDLPSEPKLQSYILCKWENHYNNYIPKPKDMISITVTATIGNSTSYFCNLDYYITCYILKVTSHQSKKGIPRSLTYEVTYHILDLAIVTHNS